MYDSSADYRILYSWKPPTKSQWTYHWKCRNKASSRKPENKDGRSNSGWNCHTHDSPCQAAIDWLIGWLLWHKYISHLLIPSPAHNVDLNRWQQGILLIIFIFYFFIFYINSKPFLLYSTLLCSTVLYSVLLDYIRYATLPYATLRYSTQRYATLLYASQSYSTLTLLYATLPYSTPLNSTLRYTTIRYFNLL